MARNADAVLVETESLESIAMGFQSDTARLKSILTELEADIKSLDELWQNKDHDIFVAEHNNNLNFLKWNYDSLSECVGALLDAWREYHALEDEIDSLAAGVWL